MDTDNFDSDGVQVRAELDAAGRELLDPVPLKPPVSFRQVPGAMSLEDMVRSIVKGETLANVAREAGLGTFEDEDDFDIEDDPIDPASPWEITFEGVPVHSGKSRSDVIEKANRGEFVPEFSNLPLEVKKAATEAPKAEGATSSSPPADPAPVDTSAKPV